MLLSKAADEQYSALSEGCMCAVWVDRSCKYW